MAVPYLPSEYDQVAVVRCHGQATYSLATAPSHLRAPTVTFRVGRNNGPTCIYLITVWIHALLLLTSKNWLVIDTEVLSESVLSTRPCAQDKVGYHGSFFTMA